MENVIKMDTVTMKQPKSDTNLYCRLLTGRMALQRGNNVVWDFETIFMAKEVLES